MNQDERRFVTLTEKQAKGEPLTDWEQKQLKRMVENNQAPQREVDSK